MLDTALVLLLELKKSRIKKTRNPISAQIAIFLKMLFNLIPSNNNIVQMNLITNNYFYGRLVKIF